MRTDNWKNVERGVAKLFGGTRTGSNGESRRDVEHPIFSIEVKHERYTKFEDAYVMIKAEHFCKYYKDIPIQSTTKEVDSSIIEPSNQGDINGSYVHK